MLARLEAEVDLGIYPGMGHAVNADEQERVCTLMSALVREGRGGSTMAVIAPVNPMAPEGKPTVMDLLRRDQEKFFALVEDPDN